MLGRVGAGVGNGVGGGRGSSGGGGTGIVVIVAIAVVELIGVRYGMIPRCGDEDVRTVHLSYTVLAP